MKYDFVTAGEQLAYFIDEEVLTNTPWSKVAQSLVYTGRSGALCEFFRGNHRNQLDLQDRDSRNVST
jgi:hypothetical protein